MGRRIHFQNVDMPPIRDRDAMLASPARLRRRFALAIRADAIKRACDDPGCRGFADAANTGQQKRMGNAPGAHSI